MDLATFAERDMADADVTAASLPPKGPSLVDEEHVTWQPSQRREVLSRLIVSTKKQFRRDSSPSASQGWPVGPLSAESSPQSDSGNFSRYLSRPLSRTRTSEENIGPLDPAKSTTSDRRSSIPFFDKENPARFLALLKGVSARVDENAGMRNHNVPGPCEATDGTAKLKRKRPQLTTVGRSLAAKRIKPSISGGEKIEENERVSSEFELELAFSNSQDLRSYQSLPDVTSEDIFSQEAKELPLGLLCDDPPQFSPTFSQKNRDLDDTGGGHPKLHPLLQNAVSEPRSRTPRESCSRAVPIRGFSNSNPVVRSIESLSSGPAPSSRTSTPGAAGRVSSRPPALGMRRTHTMPSQILATSALPTRQKGFKPPLLSNRSQGKGPS